MSSLKISGVEPRRIGMPLASPFRTSFGIAVPFVLADGHLEVPTGPGLGLEPLPGVLDEVTASTG
ncbi:hypothetical protein [Streptomyces sp. NPDC051561]|uniref:hypothetical protein n=1 Tax=Streptomyces sp. NPDC051561 TaxID=3365658 RepID=UPI0037985CE7